MEGKKVRCIVCQKRCLIAQDGYGFCHTRLNRGGKLYTLAYGRVASIALAPIEKKPLFHFYPGSRWLSLGSLGCNFRCPGCQNWEIAHARMSESGEKREREYLSPAAAIRMAKEHQCKGLSFTYNEPAVWFEYTLDCARLAKKNNLLTNYVTNGYLTEEALDEIGPYLDAFRVDLKGFSEKFYREMAGLSDYEGVLVVTRHAKNRWRMHVEIVTNIIPGWSDDETQLKGIAAWIVDELGPNTPWHVTRFIPYLRLSHLGLTPLSILEKARQIGLDCGLLYVYLGNVSGHKAENTYCRRCGSLLIRRDSFIMRRFNITGGRCPECKEPVPGKWD